ncbi:acyloxyacyl hydrolase [Geomesophilobacter sediminis]|uniref:Acyloxyacyl hydrolase n=1 Tax=Geomesophilobacter sediminis TaxID=2798584 RepID=A0A8J7IPT1_9BACT|nr:acyloxyacyl hydrolase [Geomesophilobacter sediminis]MBJ6725673.1 acyloxyacyl hydrolase [Geomesophilobacter sediminis]
MRYAVSLLYLLVIIGTATLPAPARAGEGSWEYVGGRGGINATGKGALREYEGFVAYLLPWGLGEHGGWRLNTKANGSMGMLQGSGRYGFIATMGPGLSLESPGVPLELDGGVNLAFISQDVYDGRDLNGNLQFVTHIGLNLRVAGPIGVGYRFHHMSNADLNGRQNPGVNMHLFSVIWYFDK